MKVTYEEVSQGRLAEKWEGETRKGKIVKGEVPDKVLQGESWTSSCRGDPEMSQGRKDQEAGEPKCLFLCNSGPVVKVVATAGKSISRQVQFFVGTGKGFWSSEVHLSVKRCGSWWLGVKLHCLTFQYAQKCKEF